MKALRRLWYRWLDRRFIKAVERATGKKVGKLYPDQVGEPD